MRIFRQICSDHYLSNSLETFWSMILWLLNHISIVHTVSQLSFYSLYKGVVLRFYQEHINFQDCFKISKSLIYWIKYSEIMNLILTICFSIIQMNTFTKGDPVTTAFSTIEFKTDPNINVNCCKYQRVPGDMKIFSSMNHPFIFRRCWWSTSWTVSSLLWWGNSSSWMLVSLL